MARPGCLSQLLLVSLCLMAVSQAGKEEDVEGAARMGRLAYLLSKRSAGLLAPPMAHVSRLAPYLRRVAKRDDGYWIWMPANGYMAVPKDEGSNMNANRESTSLMRYG